MLGLSRETRIIVTIPGPLRGRKRLLRWRGRARLWSNGRPPGNAARSHGIVSHFIEPLCNDHLLPAEERLLVLSARPRWSEAHLALAADLVPHVEHWPRVINTAHEKFVLQMVYGNLARLTDPAPPEAVLTRLHDISLHETFAALRRHSAFDWLHSTCVLRSGVDYAYLKGPAFAARFYPDPMQRTFRDIDILVPAHQRRDLVQIMLAKGCRAFTGRDLAFRYLDFAGGDDLTDFLSLHRVTNLLTPQGLVVEVHKEIDNHTSLFPTDILLREAGEIALRQHRLKVLSDLDHVVFACYHHTRHFWSKLHWLADIDAGLAKLGGDDAALLAHADSLGLKSTVSAVLELHHLASAARHPSDFDHPAPGIDLLNACVHNLQGGREIEVQLRQGQRMGVLGFDWQTTRLSVLDRARLGLRKLAPEYEDCLKLRWAGILRYPFASALKISRALRRRTADLMRL